MKTKIKIIFLILLIVCSACKTKQGISTQTSVLKDAEFFCSQIIANEPHFSTLNISKMDINLSLHQQSWNLYGSLRMYTDSVMIFSLQPLLGFEIFRIELYPNYLRVFDKINKKYVESGYEYFSTFTSIPISFSILQNIFKQKLFVIGREMKEYTYNDYFLLEKTNETYNLTSTSGDGKILHKIEVDANYKIRNIDLSMFLEGSTTQISYGEFGDFKKIKYPQNIALTFSSRENNAKLTFEISKATFDKPIDLTPINPSRYKRVTFKQLLTK